MKHYVLTRSTYAPDTDLAFNRRRLDLLREITVRSLASQTAPFEWIVAVHPGDPLLAERRALVGQLNATVIEYETQPVNVPWSNRIGTPTQQLAASAYFAQWRDAMHPGDRLQTRLDDDDALTDDHLERIQKAAREAQGRTILAIRAGIVSDGERVRIYRRETRIMPTLFTPVGDDLCVYDFGHRRVNDIAHVRSATAIQSGVIGAWGWLYTRHGDVISTDRWGHLPTTLTPEMRDRFDINWEALREA